MNRKFAKDFDFAQNLININAPEQHDLPLHDCLVENGDVRVSLYDVIYAVDPVTNLPSGDIACYCSSNTSTEVKQFILNNLMSDFSSAVAPSSSDLSDDDLIELTRRVDESRENYLERVQKFMKNNLEILNATKSISQDSESGSVNS